MSVRYKIRAEHGLNFLTCTIVGWIDLFSRPVYRDIVIESWKYCQQHKGFQVHAYTIMPNHIHLIASCKAPYKLTDVMRDWKRHTARQILNYLHNKEQTESRRSWLKHMFAFYAYNKKSKQDFQIWQHDNHPIELYTDAVIEQKLNYVHLNAVKAGFVSNPEHWLYSSAPFYWHLHQSTDYQPIIDIVSIWDWFYEAGPGMSRLV